MDRGHHIVSCLSSLIVAVLSVTVSLSLSLSGPQPPPTGQTQALVVVRPE